PSKLGVGLQQRMQEIDEEDLVEVMIRLNDPQDLSLWDQLEFAVARGEVVDTASYNARRAELISKRREAIAAAQLDVIDVIERVGGVVRSRCENMYCLDAALPVDSIEELTQRADIAVLSLFSTAVRESVAGAEIRAGSQLNQFISSGYDGENG